MRFARHEPVRNRWRFLAPCATVGRTFFHNTCHLQTAGRKLYVLLVCASSLAAADPAPLLCCLVSLSSCSSSAVVFFLAGFLPLPANSQMCAFVRFLQSPRKPLVRNQWGVATSENNHLRDAISVGGQAVLVRFPTPRSPKHGVVKDRVWHSANSQSRRGSCNEFL